jgi:hypothetical protein
VTFFANQPQVEHDALAVRPDAQRHQHRHALAATADADLRIPTVHEQVADVLVGQIAGPPRLEVLAQAPDQARPRILRQRTAPQQRRQRALDSPRVAAGEVDAENRFVHPRRAPFIARYRCAAPFGPPPVGLLQPRPRHRERRGPQAGGQRSLPRAMAVALALLADTRGLRSAQRGVELLLHQLFDRVTDPQPHRLLDAVTPTRRNLFLVPWLPGTVLHRVILRQPPASGRSSSFRTAPDDDAISTSPPDSRHYPASSVAERLGQDPAIRG